METEAEWSVTRNRGVNLDRPGFDSAAHGLRPLKPLVTQPNSYVHGTYSVVTDHQETFFRVEFLVRPGGHLAHGNEQTTVDVRGGKLPRLAHVDQACSCGLE